MRFESPATLNGNAKRHIDALMLIHSKALTSFREFLTGHNFIEIMPSSLQELLGNSHALPIHYPFGHAEPSLEKQLEVLAVCFERSYFTVSSGEFSPAVREIRASSEKVSSFTTLEAVSLLPGLPAETGFNHVLLTLEESIKTITRNLLENYHEELFLLGSDLNYLSRMLRRPFVRISYSEAVTLLRESSEEGMAHNGLIGASEEKELLSYFCNLPIFLSHEPIEMYHPRVQTTGRAGSAYGTKLLFPKVGLSAHGYLLNSNVKFESTEAAADMLSLGDCRHDAGLTRGALLLSFERFVSFLIGSGLV
jgi:aspartyl/asparaginyl-tRNA synthetase